MSNLTQFLYKSGVPIAAAGGTVDAITVTYAPAVAVVDMLVVAVVSAGANTSTTPTLAVNGATARTIVKNGGVALVAGDIAAALSVSLFQYNLANTRWELLNPVVAGPAAAITSGTVTGITDLVVADGGTGVSTLGDAGVLIGNGTGAVQVTSAGTSGQVLTSNGAGVDPTFQAAAAAGFTVSAESATTSGSTVTIGSIPAGTKVIILNVRGVSMAADTCNFGIQIGDAGGLETSGYTGMSYASAFTAGAPTVTLGALTDRFLFFVAAVAARNVSGSAILTLEDSSDFTWCARGGVSADADTAANAIRGEFEGYKALSAELTQIAVITSSTFDLGAINITYIG